MAESTKSIKRAGVIEVFVTYARDLEGDANAFLPVLSPAEVERAGRYRRSEDRSRFILGRGLLRSLIAGRLAVTPESLSIEVGPFGKPVVAGGPKFSVSHSERWIAIAIGDADVGIDIERRIAFEPIPAAVLSLEERERVRCAADPLDAFFSIWVAKEAVLKVEGSGLGAGTAHFTVPAYGTGRPDLVWTRTVGVEGIGVTALDPSAGVYGAVAARGDAWTLDLCQGTADECIAMGDAPAGSLSALHAGPTYRRERPDLQSPRQGDQGPRAGGD
ncbi:MAG: 4'-phosphopantetheinyl transferase superfamily protein [Bauldia sp.]